MKLREHPKLRGKWPPRWHKVHLTSSSTKHPMAEQGVLKDVKGPYTHGPWGHLALVIEYEGQEYTGQIGLDDVAFVQALFDKLKIACPDEMSLQDVGSIDLDF